MSYGFNKWVWGSLLVGVLMKSNLIAVLMSLEMAFLMIFYMIFLHTSMNWTLTLLAIMVCSAVIGITMVMKMIFSKGDEKMSSLSISK